MVEEEEQEDGAIIVVAHPDDEILWLEPWLDPGRTVVVAFPTHPRDPAVTASRETIRDGFPYGRIVHLPLAGLDVLGRSDRRRRVPTRYGVELDATAPADVRAQYVENHRALCELLDPHLASHRVVYTHNPWGEYGHEEHVQVCRAVLDVGARHGCAVWAWDGLSGRELARTSMRLRHDFYERSVRRLPRTSRPLDRQRYLEVRSIYEDGQAWTWIPGYEPPALVELVQLMRDGVELVTASAPNSAFRELQIVGAHVVHAPGIARRILGGGPLRAGRQVRDATTST